MADNPYAPPGASTEPLEPADEVVFEVSIDCASCGARIRIGDERCAGCRRRVSRDEKRALRMRWESSDREVARAGDHSFWGRVAILGVSAIATVQGGFFLAFELRAAAVWVFASAVLLWAMFAWSLRAPLPAYVGALIIYGIAWVVQIV